MFPGGDVEVLATSLHAPRPMGNWNGEFPMSVPVSLQSALSYHCTQMRATKSLATPSGTKKLALYRYSTFASAGTHDQIPRVMLGLLPGSISTDPELGSPLRSSIDQRTVVI